MIEQQREGLKLSFLASLMIWHSLSNHPTRSQKMEVQIPLSLFEPRRKGNGSTSEIAATARRGLNNTALRQKDSVVFILTLKEWGWMRMCGIVFSVSSTLRCSFVWKWGAVSGCRIFNMMILYLKLLKQQSWCFWEDWDVHNWLSMKLDFISIEEKVPWSLLLMFLLLLLFYC